MTRFLIALVLAMIAQSVALAAYAQGQTEEVFRGRDGDYEIVVGVQPIKPVVGTVHFSILPLNAQTSRPVQNAIVTLFAREESGDELFKAPALSAPRFPSYYQSNFKFESAGTWELRVDIESAELGPASVTFPLEVGAQAFAPTNVEGTIFFFVLLAAMFGGIFYVWHTIRRQRRARAA